MLFVCYKSRNLRRFEWVCFLIAFLLSKHLLFIDTFWHKVFRPLRKHFRDQETERYDQCVICTTASFSAMEPRSGFWEKKTPKNFRFSQWKCVGWVWVGYLVGLDVFGKQTTVYSEIFFQQGKSNHSLVSRGWRLRSVELSKKQEGEENHLNKLCGCFLKWWVPPKIIHFNRAFPCKWSILG